MDASGQTDLFDCTSGEAFFDSTSVVGRTYFARCGLQGVCVLFDNFLLKTFQPSVHVDRRP